MGTTPTEESPSGGNSSVYKRKRVAKACQSCRSMKAKCDGQWPECGRCRGYGYTCIYRAHRPRLGGARSSPPFSYGTVSERLPELCEAISQQGALLERAISLISSNEEKEDAIKKHARIKAQLERALSTIGANPASEVPESDAAATEEGKQQQQLEQQQQQLQQQDEEETDEAPSYLGEVSDVRFFNLVKRVLETDGSGGSQKVFERYDRDVKAAQAPLIASKSIEPPDPELAERFLSAYFSTIHLAYPFIPKTLFMKEHQKLLGKHSQTTSNDAQLALIYTIYAIGSYYTSFPGKEEGVEVRNDHGRYFLKSLALSPTAGLDRSLTYVSLLLAQCFYLLAVCRTDSCWTTLGQAARAAQSIGLHVESEPTHALTGPERIEIEKRRRVWFSIYILDRLLALQLGRPPAIHDDDCYVPLPSRLGDADIDWEHAEHLNAPDDGPLPGDYFIQMVFFSEIIGKVLRSLYCPKGKRVVQENISTTKELDRTLLKWKMELPRVLRFDLGHAFERSYIYKRQRNMLAIKFHHLRALIHRPYLCYPLLKHQDDADSGFTHSDWPFVHAFEKTCTSEARETARLLHSITSEQDLVHSFPWWQMISCLVCAGSILLVSSLFTQAPEESPEAQGQDTAELHDDAETCLKVFEALSINSDGARIARDMMKALKDTGTTWKETNTPPATVGSQDRSADANHHHHRPNAANTNTAAVAFGGSLPTPDVVGGGHEDGSNAYGQGYQMAANQCWPAELVDSMVWSSQFFDVTHGGMVNPEGSGVGQHHHQHHHHHQHINEEMGDYLGGGHNS